MVLSLFALTPFDATMEALSLYVQDVPDVQRMAMAAEALRVMEEEGRTLRSLLDSEFHSQDLRDFAEAGD